MNDKLDTGFTTLSSIDRLWSFNQLFTHAKAMIPNNTIISLTEKLMENYSALIRQNEID